MGSRLSDTGLRPSKPPALKRDRSILDWHYKRPTDEELEDGYECFTEEEWAAHYQAAKEARSLTMTSRKRNNPAIMRPVAKRDACSGCQVFYQLWARNRGLCNPIEGAITPLDRIGREDEFEDD